MADKKVSELDTITGADTASDDFFLIVDTSGSVSKKISRAELTESIEIGLNEIETDLSFGDNIKAKFGASDDLQIYHDGSNSYVRDVGTGHLNISGEEVRILNSGNSELKALFTTDGSVELYYDNSKTFETASGGISVTGNVGASGYLNFTSASSFIGAGNNAIQRDTASGLVLTGQGSTSDFTFINDLGTTWLSVASGTTTANFAGDINFSATTTNVSPTTSDGSDNARVFFNGGGAASPSRGSFVGVYGNENSDTGRLLLSAGNVSGGDIEFHTGNSVERMRIDSSGNVGIGTSAPVGLLDLDGGSSAFTIQLKETSGAYQRMGFQKSNDLLQMGEFNNDGSVFTPILNVSGNGDRVGIGTTSPGTTLECAGTITANPASGSNILFENGSGAAVGRVTFDSTNLKVRGDSSKGLKLGANGSDVITIDTSGNTSCSGNLTVTGSISKGSGSFRISHPLPQKSKTHDLVHSFIEGPKVDLIYRGAIQLQNGEASINLDEVSKMTNGTFEVLCDDVQCFTTNETGWTAVKGSVSGNMLTIQAQEDTCTDTISWMVVGERKDQNIISSDLTDNDGKLIVEPLKS